MGRGTELGEQPRTVGGGVEHHHAIAVENFHADVREVGTLRLGEYQLEDRLALVLRQLRAFLQAYAALSLDTHRLYTAIVDRPPAPEVAAEERECVI